MASPHLIELDEAVSRIKQACDGRTHDSHQSPFFFMVGAGISFPSVPLAPEIVSQCKKTASQFGRSEESSCKDPLDLYSHWFEMAYGEPNQRQRYLRDLIDGKQITHANFRLAHLVLNNRISNIIVTTNFDDYLTKALALFGKRHIVCDHPQTVGRINPAESILQIVHLHGTYWFYDCCNLRGELQDRADQSQQTTTTMASLLDMILWDRSPLITGYSGWEGDVFMRALQRRLVRPLGNNVYWFCFQRDVVDSMPGWLRNNPNIRFVVPRERPTRLHADEEQARGITESPSELVGQVKSKGDDDVPSLPADKVFDALICAFELEAPALTKDPLKFFAEQLDESLPKDEASDKDADIYAIKNVIERVRKAKERETEVSERAVEPSAASLEAIRDAMRRADYRAAIRSATEIQLTGLLVEQLTELSDAAWLSALKIYDNSQEEISAYDLVVAISDRLRAESPNLKPSNEYRVAMSLFNKGVTLGTLNRSEEAITVYDEVVRRYGDASEPEFRLQVANALYNKGFRLGTLNRSEEEISVYDEVVRRYGGAPELELRVKVAKSLVNKGVTLGTLNRSEEAVAVCDEVLRRFGDTPEQELRVQVANVLVAKGFRLGALNRSEEAVAVYEELVRRFGDAPEPELRMLVAKALVNKGVAFSTLNRSEDEVIVYDEVVRRYGDASEPELRVQVAKALVYKGITLGTLNRSEEAVTVYDEVVRRYGDAPEPEFRVHVAKSLVNKGVTLGTLNRSEEAVTVYDEVLRRYGDAPEPELRALVTKARLMRAKGVTQ